MIDEIEARVRRANLVAHDEQLDQLFGRDLSDRLLSLVQQKKEGRMTDTSKQRPIEKEAAIEPPLGSKSQPDPTRRVRPRVALAAFLGGGLAVIVTAIVLLFAFDRTEDVAAPPADMAREFVEARSRWDADGMQSLLAPDAVFLGDLVDTGETLPPLADFERATGWTYIVDQCIETTGEPFPLVSCAYSWENDWSRALGVGPFGGSEFRFVFEDGRITEVTNNFNLRGLPRGWDPFVDWLEQAHPEDVPVMIDESFALGPIPYLTPESIALWEIYTDEFVAVEGNS